MAVVYEDSAIEALDRYLDSLRSNGRRSPLAAPAGLQDLASLAHSLKRVLLPVEPNPVFRQALHARLLTVAKVSDFPPAPWWRTEHGRELLIGAAVGSVISVAGIAALLARLRWTPRRAA